MDTCIHNRLTLGEDVFVLWASDHLQVHDLMRVAFIPERSPEGGQESPEEEVEQIVSRCPGYRSSLEVRTVE